MVGGAGDIKPANPEIQAIIDPLKEAALAKVSSEPLRNGGSVITASPLICVGTDVGMEWRLHRMGRAQLQTAGVIGLVVDLYD